jgi:hypothetical protein
MTVERQRGQVNASSLAYTDVWNCGSKFPKSRVVLAETLLGYSREGLGRS